MKEKQPDKKNFQDSNSLGLGPSLRPINFLKKLSSELLHYKGEKEEEKRKKKK